MTAPITPTRFPDVPDLPRAPERVTLIFDGT